MKSIITFLVFLTIITCVSAVSIDAPALIPEDSSWGFSVDLSGSDSVLVNLDGSKIVEVYSGGNAVAYAPFSPYVSNAFVYSGTLYVYHFGLSRGNHTIEAGSESFVVEAVELPGASFKDEVVASAVAKVDEKIGLYDQKFLDQKIDNDEFWKNIQNNIASINELKSDSDSTVSKVDSLESSVSKIASLESRILELEGITAAEEAARIAEEQAAEEARLKAEEDAKKSPITGFVNLASDVAFPLGALGVLLLIGVVIFIAKDHIPKMDDLYTRTDENNLPLGDDDIAEELTAGSKWAFSKKEE